MSDQRRESPGWVRPLKTAGVLLAVAALVLAFIRPQWVMRIWDASGISCGWDLSREDPADFDSTWTPWGEAEHIVHDFIDHPDADTYRAAVEALAGEFGLTPVAEIPDRQEQSGAEGQTLGTSYSPRISRDQLVLGTSAHYPRTQAESTFHIAALDPGTGEALWHWDLSDGYSRSIFVLDEYLVFRNLVDRGYHSSGRDLVSEIVTVSAETGTQQNCQRYRASVGFATGYGDAVLLGGTGNWDPLGTEPERRIHRDTLLSVSLPDLSPGHTQRIDYVEDTPDSFGRGHPYTVLDESTYLLHAYTFGAEEVEGDLLHTPPRDAAELEGGIVPVEAFSMTTGDKLWEYGDPGDPIAVVGTVPGTEPVHSQGPRGDDAESFILLAELDEINAEQNTASVTLRMLDSTGSQLWELATAEVDDAQDFLDIGPHWVLPDGQYVALLEDLVIVHTAPGTVTAVDASTGEELWSIEDHDLRIREAFSYQDMTYLLSDGSAYLLSNRTGENSTESPEFLAGAELTDLTAIDENYYLLDTEHYGSVILQRQE